MHFKFNPEGVCCRAIEFDLTPEKTWEGDAVNPHSYVVHHIKFTGGCPGNLSFIAKYLTGFTADYLIKLCKGHKCGNRPTSCMNEFGKCLEKAVEKMEEREWTLEDCI